jgi:hypothetical protein
MGNQAMEPNCDHFYKSRVRGGEPLSVRACSLCGQPDWADLRGQLEKITNGMQERIDNQRASITRLLEHLSQHHDELGQHTAQQCTWIQKLWAEEKGKE